MREPVELDHSCQSPPLQSPQNLKPIYFPSWFDCHKGCSQLYLFFPQALGNGFPPALCPRGETSEQCDGLWPTSHLLFILLPTGPAQQPHVRTHQPSSQRAGLLQLRLSPLTNKENKDSLPNLPRSKLGTGSAPFYVFTKFPNMFISAAALWRLSH